jgi:hypothetical protein
MNRRPWKRLAAIRAARRRVTEFLRPPEDARLEAMPALEPPDDDREFLTALTTGIALRPEAA